MDSFIKSYEQFKNKALESFQQANQKLKEEENKKKYKQQMKSALKGLF